MKHHLLTRAVYNPDQWTATERRHRLDLFRDVTAASVAAQTVKPDKWVIAVHPDDPDLHKRDAIAQNTGVEALMVYVDDTGPTRDQAAIAAYSAPWRTDNASEAFLTTRLDDDDGLTADHFARVRGYIEALPNKPEAFVAILPVGIRVYGGRYTEVRHNSNAMATLYTPAGDTRHIYGHRHRNVRDHYPVIDVDLAPAWLWVRHDNTLSDWKRAMRPIKRPVTELFPHVEWDTIGLEVTTTSHGGGRIFA